MSTHNNAEYYSITNKKLLKNNRARYEELLENSKCSNIRTFLRAVDHYAQIYNKNKAVLNKYEYSASRYFSCLLALVIFIEHHADEKEAKLVLNNGIDVVSRYIVEKRYILTSTQDDDDRTEEERAEIERKLFLLSEAFDLFEEHQSQSGFQSLVRDGYYEHARFTSEFDGWKEPSDFVIYNDTFKFWYLDDKTAETKFQNVYNQVFEEKTVTNPIDLLLFANRIASDIVRGVVAKDLKQEISKLDALIEELYESEKMESVERIEMNFFGDRFLYCKELYEKPIDRNDRYQKNRKQQDLSNFWKLLQKDPEKAEELIDLYKGEPIFAQFSNPAEIVDALESLDNKQLFEFTRALGSRLTDSSTPSTVIDLEHEQSKPVVLLIDNLYGSKHGVRAGHFKQIQYMLETKQSRRQLS